MLQSVHKPLKFLIRRVYTASPLSRSQFHLLGTLAVILCDIQALIDAARNGLDLGAQLLFNALQVKAVIIRDQVDRQTQVPKATWRGQKSFESEAADTITRAEKLSLEQLHSCCCYTLCCLNRAIAAT